MARQLPARDAEVPSKSEAELADLAYRLRRLVGIDSQLCVDISLLLDFLVANELPNKGRLHIERRNPNTRLYEAVVIFNPLKLSIEAHTLTLAHLGDPRRKYIIAHEIGHMVIHDEYAKPFSVHPVTKNLFSERSAEWQANTFADHLLVPDYILIDMKTPAEICKECITSVELSERRFALRRTARRSLRRYSGEACKMCQGFYVVERGTYLECDECEFITDYIL